MKRNIVIVVLLFVASMSVFAQKKAKPTPKSTSKTTASVEQTDPAAKDLLDKLRQKYEGFSTLEADFSLSIEIPNRKKEVQTGKMVQSGDKYRVNLSDQEVICDGQNTYLYLKKNKEIQINDADNSSEANSFSPKNMLRTYNQGNFICYTTGNGEENGKQVTFIEVKPSDRNNAPYSKCRLAVDKKNNQVVSMFTVNRDGSRYKLTISKLITNKPVNESQFNFDKSKYPGVHIEDLRTN